MTAGGNEMSKKYQIVNCRKQEQLELFNYYLHEKEKRNDAERRGNYWRNVSCVAIAGLMSLLVSLIFRLFI